VVLEKGRLPLLGEAHDALLPFALWLDLLVERRLIWVVVVAVVASSSEYSAHGP